MKAEITVERFEPDKRKAFGVRLVAETDDEKELLRRLDKSGIKINGIGGGYSWMDLTPKDLIGR